MGEGIISNMRFQSMGEFFFPMFFGWHIQLTPPILNVGIPCWIHFDSISSALELIFHPYLPVEKLQFSGFAWVRHRGVDPWHVNCYCRTCGFRNLIMDGFRIYLWLGRLFDDSKRV